MPAAQQTPFGIPPVSQQPPVPAKAPFDDFDDFDDLEDAKEGDADELESISAHDRSGLDDFNPMFDSPPTSKGQEHSHQQSNGFGGSNNAFGDFTQSPISSNHQTTTSAVNDNHDWDAIFAGLDSSTPAAAESPKPEPAKVATNDTATAAPERPQIGRALTEAGVHDDPILKNLTGMGYKRADALAALEKYDYNLERVSDYLEARSDLK